MSAARATAAAIGGPRQRSWVVLAQDGRHTTVGRHTDTTPAEVAALAEQCDQARLAAWLAVLETQGDRVGLMQVQCLGSIAGDWHVAERAFGIRNAGRKGI